MLRPRLFLWILAATFALPGRAAPETERGASIDPTYVALRPGAIRDVTVGDEECGFTVVRAHSSNPDRIKVYARDADGNLVPGDGETAEVTGMTPAVFALVGEEDVQPSEYVPVKFCWTDESPCEDDFCEDFPDGGFTITSFLYGDPTTFAGNPGAALAVDPIHTGTGEFVMPPTTLLDLGPVDFAVYYANGIRTDNNFVSKLGSSWSHSYDWSLDLLEFTESVVEIYTPAGEIIRFEKGPFDDDYVLRPYDHVPYQLARSGDDFILADPFEQTLYRFEPTGALTSITDRHGNQISLTYVSNRVSQVTDGRGRTLDFTYVSGKLGAVTDGIRTISFAYTGGLLTSMTDANGETTTFVYDADTAPALITSVTYPRGNVRTTQVYDSEARRVLSQTDADGNTALLGYDDGTGERTITDPLGNVKVHTYDDGALAIHRDEAALQIQVAYDEESRPVQFTDRNGGVTQITYHLPSGKVSSMTQADGSTTTFTYGERTVAVPAPGSGVFRFYDLTSRTRADGTTESFTYDARGNALTHVDPAGETWSWSYDTDGSILTSTNPAGGTWVNTFNPDGTQASTTDPAGNTTTFGYDGLFRLTTITHPDATTETFTYDAMDRLLTRTDELGHTTTYDYDANGNLVAASTPLGETWSFAFTAMDLLATVTDPLGNVVASISYDQRQLPLSVADALGNVTVLGHDPVGRPSSRIDPLGNASTVSYDPEGVLAGITDPVGRSTTLTTDVMGRLTSATMPLGSTLELGYDGMGRLTSVEDAHGSSSTFTHGPRDLLAGIVFPVAGVEVSYQRDALGMLVEVIDPAGESWGWSHDDRGLTTGSSDPLGNTRTVSHDARQRLDVVTLAGGLGSVDVDHDARGLVSAHSYSDGTALTFAHDADGRLTSATSPDGTITFEFDAASRITACNGFEMAHDAAGRLVSLTLAPGKVITYAYDARSLLTSVTDWVDGSTTFSYDAAGRMISITRPNGTETTYAYDDDDHVVGIDEGALGSIALTRNDRGDVTASVRDLPVVATPSATDATWTHDVASQVATHAHDALGRVTDDGVRTYTWNLAHLESYHDGGNPVSFGHDAFGYPISRSDAEGTRQFGWTYGLRGLPLLSVIRNGSGSDVRYQVHLPTGLLLHAIDASDDSRRFFHFDEMGSTTMLTDDGGLVVDAFAYTPYGVRLAGGEELFTFHGRFGVMTEGALYRMGVRLYDPGSARFLSRDPLGGVDPRTVNPYPGLAANPLRFVDPKGTNVDSPSSWQMSGRESAWTFLLAEFAVPAMRRHTPADGSYGVDPSVITQALVDQAGIPGMDNVGSHASLAADDFGWFLNAGGGNPSSVTRTFPVNHTETMDKFGRDPNGFANGGFYYQPGQVFCCGDDYRNVGERRLKDDDPDEQSFLHRAAYSFWSLTWYGGGAGTLLNELFFNDLWDNQERVQQLRSLNCPIKRTLLSGAVVECQMPLLHATQHQWFGYGGTRSGKPLIWPRKPSDNDEIRKAFPKVYLPKPKPYGHPDRP